ncbi:MAG: Hsp33 family molecular chaperone HslO [Mediterraneibacter gnavus]
MKDYIVRATAANAQIRAFAASTTELVEEARTRHNTSPVATAALGRLLTAGAMMGSMMKNPTDVLTLQVRCGGPIGGMTVTADSKGEVKGYVHNPDVMLPPKNGKLDVGGALGPGFLNVIKDMGLKEPYSGQTILQTGEIAEDLTYYFATSEQVPSSVGLGVLMEKDNTVRCAGGFIVQVMPFIEEEVLSKLEENIKNIQSVTAMLDNGHTPEEMLNHVLEGLDVEITDTLPAKFDCNCSKERIEKAIISVGKKEIQEMIDDGKDIEVKCHFCNTAYTFSVDELKGLLKKKQIEVMCPNRESEAVE